MFAVIALESILRGRQDRPLRVVDEVQSKRAGGHAVTERVQPLERPDTRFENAFATLPVDVVFQVTRQRRHDLDTLLGEEVGEILLPRLLEDRQVATVHHVHAQSAGPRHEHPEMRVQFGCAARDVESRHARSLQECENLVDRLPGHLLGAAGTGIHVAMHAGLVALVAQVHLQSFKSAAAYRGKIGKAHARQRCVHRSGFLHA